MRQIKWGVLGCSGFARRRSIPAMLLTPSVELVGVASRTREKSEKFSEQFSLPKTYDSYQQLIDDPEIEAVHIPLPNSMHCDWTLAALERGKHVLSEKPFATKSSEAQIVVDRVKGTDLKVMEAFMWPFHPQHQKAKELVSSGVIGKVTFVRASFSYVMTAKTGIRLDKELGGGSLLDVGCYPVSSARYYFGGEPLSVFARGEFSKDLGVDTAVTGIMEFEQGRAVFDCSFSMPYRTDLEVVGETGRIYFPRAWQPHEQATMFVNDEQIILPPANHYVNLFEHFSKSIGDDEKLAFDAGDALKQMKTLEAIDRSLHSGKIVEL
ncbi:MAG: Gfo/Idh/MocA family oxidoreductase [Candidatus Obscuribacterales bacterium]|nr:Gfo/Idh/MocA family oxidoreductase [Candidatus Obscuribacterales bacterium]